MELEEKQKEKGKETKLKSRRDWRVANPENGAGSRLG